MRAEAQSHIDQINAATALLRRFLDWDRALRRLDELNTKVEDPSLWDDPKAAQEVMRERRRLDEAINATRAIERELADTAELIELANWLSHETAPDEAIFIIGYDWSSALPYYADRRSVMFPAPYADASLRHSPTDLALWTGGRPVGAVVDCGGQADARLSTWMRPLETRYATSTIVTGCRVYH